MAKRYIIDEIRAHNWMVRMRDRETGEVVEVPLELGSLWPGKLRGDAVPREPSEPSALFLRGKLPILGALDHSTRLKSRRLGSDANMQERIKSSSCTDE